MDNQNILRDSWASLGIACSVYPQKTYNPEEALINLVKSDEFPDDKKMMSMALTWLMKYSKLVHVERLQNLSKTLRPHEIVLLGAVASKCLKYGDHRWKKIERLALKLSKKANIVFASDSSNLLKMRGMDKDFERFKIYVSPIEIESDKKLFVREKIFEDNPWLKSRLLFGTNLRADVATVISLKLANTAYAAAKYLQCSTSAVYRNWQDLKDVKWEELSRQIL